MYELSFECSRALGQTLVCVYTLHVTFRSGCPPFLRSSHDRRDVSARQTAPSPTARMEAPGAYRSLPEEALNLLMKITFNVIGSPDEAKFRSLKKSNGAIARLLAVTGVPAVLRAFGFVEGPEAWVLPGAHNEAVAAELTEALALVQEAAVVRAASSLTEERKAELAKLAALRSAEKADRERMAALAKRDQAERKAAEGDRVIAASVAQERKFGVTAKQLDLTKRGGG